MPTVKHGDNSIQSYGVESASDERVEAATAVEAYLDAQVAERWPEACSLLAATIRVNLEALVKKASSAKAESCPAGMAAFIGGIPKAPLRVISEVHVLSMREEGDRGFLIYEDGQGAADEMPMEREDGHWKVRALIAKELIVH